MILKLVPHSSPILRQKCDMFNYSNPQTDSIQLAKDLYETLMSTSYLGLSAPQVGIPLRVFALRTNPGIVCFNPRVVDTSSEEIILDEMCMTFLHLAVPIKRPKKIKVRYFEPNGQAKTEVFDGNSWVSLNMSVASVGLSGEAEALLDWARKKRDEEMELSFGLSF